MGTRGLSDNMHPQNGLKSNLTDPGLLEHTAMLPEGPAGKHNATRNLSA